MRTNGGSVGRAGMQARSLEALWPVLELALRDVAAPLVQLLSVAMARRGRGSKRGSMQRLALHTCCLATALTRAAARAVPTFLKPSGLPVMAPAAGGSRPGSMRAACNTTHGRTTWSWSMHAAQTGVQHAAGAGVQCITHAIMRQVGGRLQHVRRIASHAATHLRCQSRCRWPGRSSGRRNRLQRPA